MQKQEIQYTSANLESEEQRKQIEFVSMQAFLACYQNLDPQKDLELGQGVTKREFIKETIDEEIEELKRGEKDCEIATKWDKIVGMCTYDQSKKSEIYLSQLAVLPKLWQQGIGLGLIGAIAAKKPKTKKITLITRRINTGGLKFYQKIGFVETEFMREGYDHKKYIGYEHNNPAKLIPE